MSPVVPAETSIGGRGSLDPVGSAVRVARGLAVVALLTPWWALIRVALTADAPSWAAAIAETGLGGKDGVRTVVAVVFASVLATAWGLGLSRVLLAPVPRGLGAGVRWVFVAWVLAPLAVHPASLAGLWASGLGLGPLPAPGGGEFLAVLVLAGTWALAYAPLAALLLAALSRSVPDAAKVAGDGLLPPMVRWRILELPRLRSAVGCVGLAVAVLALQDGVTPPLLGVETVASRLLAAWQTSLDPVAPVIASTPTWLAGVVLATWVILRLPRGIGSGRPRRAPAPSWAWVASVAYVVIATLVPLAWAWVLGTDGPPLSSWLGRCGEELATTGRLALVAGGAAIAGVVGWAFAVGVAQGRPVRGGAGRRLVSTLALVTPLATPPLVLGLAGFPGGAALGAGADVPRFVAAIILRTLPWALIVAIATAGRPHPALAGLGLRDLRRGARAVGERAGLLLGAAVAAFPFALREVELFSVAAPAGWTSGAARMVQLLHYGMGDEAARWVVVQYAVGILWGLGVVLLRRRLP